MALNFPDSPTVGEVYSAGDRAWEWTGFVWKSVISTLIIDGGSA